MDDKQVIELLITDKGKINSHYKQIISKNRGLKYYLENRYQDSEDYNETIYRIWKGIEIRPVCPVCGKPVKFVSGNGFRECCSVSCSKQLVKQSEQVITDDLIKQEYIHDGVYDTTNKLHPKFLKDHNYYDYLINRYDDTDSIGEVVYRICHNIDEKPKCVVCGNPCRFINHIKGYDIVCCNECMHAAEIPEITDEYIKSLDEKGNLYKPSWIGYKKIEEYLKKKFGDKYRTYKEAVYMVKNDMYEQPKCPVCGKPALFDSNSKKYNIYCSQDCYNLDVLNKHAKQLSKLYNVPVTINENRNFVFHNLCKVHSEFEMTSIQIRNRCGQDRFNIYANICPICNPERNPETTIEAIVKHILDDLDITYEQHRRDIISPKELDFYLPDYNLAIECNGMFWHSEGKKVQTYHYDKKKLCEEKGIRLIYFWETDIRKNTDKVKDIISSICQKNRKIYARLCTVKEIKPDVCENFLNKYHLQGSINAKIKLGLFYNDKLIEVMTFGRPRTFMHGDSSKYNYELYRLCTKSGYTVIGGASKLFNYFTHNYKWKSIISYSMSDISDGLIYEKLGFNLFNETKYGFFYYDTRKHITVNRYTLAKHKIDDGSGRTAEEIISDMGYIKCYNSGTRKYVMINNN